MNDRVIRGLRLMQTVAVSGRILGKLTTCIRGFSHADDRETCGCQACRNLKDLDHAARWLDTVESPAEKEIVEEA